MTTELECLDGPEGCEGAVEYRTTPDRSDGKAFPRCEGHFEKRLDSCERTLELLPPVPPAWFDESYAGEHWNDNY